MAAMGAGVPRTTRGICVTDANGNLIESVNPAFARMHGGAIEDFVGLPITALLTAQKQAQLPHQLAKLDAEDFARAESEHVRLDGSAFPVMAEVLASRDAQGRLLYRIAWFDDLTAQHAAEAEHREATEIFETAFSRAPMGVALIGLDGRFLRVNAALCEMLSRSNDELIARPHSPSPTLTIYRSPRTRSRI
jgi:PAS domain S-box-containing protein